MRPRCASLNLAPPLPKYSHPREVCAVCVWSTGMWRLWWLHTERTTRLWAVKKAPFVSCVNAVKRIMVCVLTPIRLQQRIKCQDSEEPAAQGLSQPAAVRPRSVTGQTLSHRTPGDVVRCLSFHLEEPILISAVGPAATAAR